MLSIVLTVALIVITPIILLHDWSALRDDWAREGKIFRTIMVVEGLSLAIGFALLALCALAVFGLFLS